MPRSLLRGYSLATVDFFRTYADSTHHGKEEDILYRDLIKKAYTQNISGLWTN